MSSLKSPNYRILLVDDEEEIRFTLGCLLKSQGYLVDGASNHIDAIVCLQAEHYDLVFVDIILNEESGIDVLRDIKAISPTTQVVMFTGYPEVDSAAAAVRLGAFDFITKPVRQETLTLIARHALNVKQMKDKLKRSSANMEAIFRTVSDGIIMVDKDGCIAHFNPTAEKNCGYSSEQIGCHMSSAGLGCNGVCTDMLLGTLSSNAPHAIRRFECRTQEGISRIASITAAPVIEADGSVSGAVAVIRDETHMVELEYSLKKRGRFQDLIGISECMQRVYSLIESLANVPTTVLINGESGTGKELVAAALHTVGCRATKPFVKVNCSALSESLLESELFGHVRGAFTGAIADRIGRFKKADGGTLFLDEIGDISPATQMRLLRVLQESEFERVGESTSTKVDVRIIAATNQNLAEKVRQGTFRQDLYYRLNVVRLVLPALKERLEDLEHLTAHFIEKFNVKLGKNVRCISDDAMELLRAHTWPGNVRELEHVIEHAGILCQTDIIIVRDLPQDLIDSVGEGACSSSDNAAYLPPTKKRPTLEEALKISGGNKTRAAELLGVSRLTVYRQLKKCAAD